jgi:hypothetical protein
VCFAISIHYCKLDHETTLNDLKRREAPNWELSLAVSCTCNIAARNLQIPVFHVVGLSCNERIASSRRYVFVSLEDEHPVTSCLSGPYIFLSTLLPSNARNGPVYAGIPCRSFFLFLNFTHIHTISAYFSRFFFLTVYPCFALKKYTGTSEFPFRPLPPSTSFVFFPQTDNWFHTHSIQQTE